MSKNRRKLQRISEKGVDMYTPAFMAAQPARILRQADLARGFVQMVGQG
jgi:hypothetical protein